MSKAIPSLFEPVGSVPVDSIAALTRKEY